MVEYPKPGENDPVSNAQRRCHFDNQSVEEYRLSLRRLNVAIAAETSQEKLAREREAKNYSDGFTFMNKRVLDLTGMVWLKVCSVVVLLAGGALIVWMLVSPK